MNTAALELIEFNVFQEYNALKKILTTETPDDSNIYKQARYNILKYMINCVKNDPANGDFSSEENTKLMKEAGELLDKEGGFLSMHDDLVWSFIPNRYHREIDLMWDGIGDWQS